MKLFIDDIRNKDGWEIARSSLEAISFIKANGIPSVISFDHDLGGDDTSMVFINEMITLVLDAELKLPSNFSYIVHSANPVGAENIKSKMDSFLRFIS